jgi:hypothetical protein
MGWIPLRQALEWDDKRWIIVVARSGVLLLLRETRSAHWGGAFWATC